MVIGEDKIQILFIEKESKKDYYTQSTLTDTVTNADSHWSHNKRRDYS